MKFFESITGKATLIPLISTGIPAGFPSPALDHLEERIDLARQLAPNPLSTFYCFSEGDSMIDACIPPKSILVVDKSLQAQSGDIVVAYVNGGFTVKYMRIEKGKCTLVPANKKKNYLPIEIDDENELIIWGVVTNVVIDTKNIRLCTLW